jgi:protein pelota
MIILQSDFKKGTVKIKLDNPEDIWYLNQIIDQGDLVKGKTTRKIKIGEGENAKVAKKTLNLMIEAETIDFGSSGDTLRINGKVKVGPEDVPRDSYHTITLEENSEFTLQKIKWLEYQKKKLTEATEKKYNHLICLLDREEALLALTKNSGYDILTRVKGEVPKKAQKVEIKKDFSQELIRIIEMYAERYKLSTIILASPAFYKEDLLKKITNAELKKKIILATCSAVDESSLDEITKSPGVAEALKFSRLRKESLILNELLTEISKDALAVYGWNEVKKAVDVGAISKLLITDEFIKQKKLNENFTELNQLMKNVDSLQGEIHILSSKNEPGKKLDGLSGIAAILRYKI